MCRWIPEEVLRTFSQFFHKHLNMTFIEFCKRRLPKTKLKLAGCCKILAVVLWFLSVNQAAIKTINK